MSTLTTTGADTARAIAQIGKEPDWLESWRLAAWESYQGAPLPDRVLHLWRYTEPEKFLIDKVEPLPSRCHPLRDLLQRTHDVAR